MNNRSDSGLSTLDPLDSRLNAYRGDLADARLRGRVRAKKFTEGRKGVICVPVADLKASGNSDANTEHQLLLGEKILIFEKLKDWLWVQSMRDGYVGYVASQNIEESGNIPEPSHIVCALSTFLYPEAKLRQPPKLSLSMGSQVAISGYQTIRGLKYALLAGGGALVGKHLRKIGNYEKDYVDVCECFLHVPYLWGGASAFGVDCSGLVQLAMRLCGHEVLRDSDMQAATLGKRIDPGKNKKELIRGDLIFWSGHIAVYQGRINQVPHIIHANGYSMNVTTEPLHKAIRRIAPLYGEPVEFRRPL